MYEGTIEKVINRHENLVGKILFIIGIVQMILGIILGFIFSMVPVYDGYDFDMNQVGITMDVKIFILSVISGFIGGMIFVGFSEVIKLLDNINRKMGPRTTAKGAVSNSAIEKLDLLSKVKGEDLSVSWKLGEVDKQKIIDLYGDRNIIDIFPSQLESYCIVKLQGDEGEIISIVDVGGFGAQEIHDKEAKKTILEDNDMLN